MVRGMRAHSALLTDAFSSLRIVYDAAKRGRYPA
jgi:hypothetical protein